MHPHVLLPTVRRQRRRIFPNVNLQRESRDVVMLDAFNYPAAATTTVGGRQLERERLGQRIRKRREQAGEGRAWQCDL